MTIRKIKVKHQRAIKKSPVAPSVDEINGVLSLFQQGNFTEAELIAGSMIVRFPRHNFAWKLLGAIRKRQGSLQEALSAMKKASDIMPADYICLRNIAVLLGDLKSHAEAEKYALRALAIKSDYADAHNTLSITLRSQGKLASAEQSCRRALQLQPESTQFLFNLGLVLHEAKKYAEAEICYRNAIEANANFAEAYCSLGITLQTTERIAEAETACRLALTLKPDYAEGYNSLGCLLHEQSRYVEAETNYREALRLMPGVPEFLINLGNCLRAQHLIIEAEECYRSVLLTHANNEKAYNNLGNILQEQGRIIESETILRSVLKSNPDYVTAFSNLLFLLNYHPQKSSRDIFSEYIKFDECFCLPLRTEWKPHLNSRSKNRRLKIGYVSPQFCQHPVSNFLEPLLACHDKERVELYAYAEFTKEDSTTDRYRTYFDHWIPTKGMTDADMVAHIRAARIDILVDLAGHTGQNRLLVFARKPAPVSLHWLDFGYTTGLTAIDYYLTDDVSVPAESEELFSETPWRIETPCMAYRPTGGMGEVSTLPALECGHITFGCLSRAVRINHRTIRVWSEILKQVPLSILSINSGNFKDPAMQDVLATQFASHGIGRDQLTIGYTSPPWDLLRSIDIGLDCFPHNSGTTLIETLYMGAPFITLADRPSVGRLGSSILKGIGHPEWIAHTEEEYIEKAVTLANNIPKLAILRANLRQEMEQSPLMDESAFASKVEAAYQQMFAKWCEEQQ